MASEVDAWMEMYENPMKPSFKGNLASFFPKAKAHASLMFYTGASTEGDFPSLEGGKNTSRMMKLTDLADVKAKSAELKRIVKAWCDQKDAG